MIARAFHAANEGLDVAAVVLPELDGVELHATLDRIGGWGGDPRLYAFLLDAALSAGDERDPASVRALGVIAGWRAGVVALRDDALAHAAARGSHAVAVALGLEPSQLRGFVGAQSADPFAWPTGGRLVARVGGFSGFGQEWMAPPSDAAFVAPAVIETTCGVEHWAIHADVFGARLIRIETRAPIVPSPLSATTDADSYLLTISRPWIA